MKKTIAAVAILVAVAWIGFTASPSEASFSAPGTIEVVGSPCATATFSTSGDAGVAMVASGVDGGSSKLQSGGRYRVFCSGDTYLSTGAYASTSGIPVAGRTPEEMSFVASGMPPQTVYGVATSGTPTCSFCPIKAAR